MALDKTKLLESLLKGFDDAKAYAQTIWNMRIEEFKLLKGKSRKKKYKSEADFSVPYADTLCENVFPLLVARLPEGQAAARNFERDGKAADLMNELLKYTFDVELFEQKFLATTKEAMWFDTGWNEVCWKYENEKTDHPSIKRKDTFKMLVHPRKEELDDRWPIYEIAEMSKREMRELGWDVDNLGESKLNDEEFRNQRLQTLNYNVAGSTDKSASLSKDASGDDLYEVIKVWLRMDLSLGDDEEAEEQMACVVICNREKIVNTKPYNGKKLFQSPYDHDYFPYIPLPYNPAPGVIYGESFIRPIADQQRELNALENMKADNYKRRNNPPLLVKRSSNVDLSTLRFETAAPWVVNETTDIVMQLLPDLATSIDNQQQQIRRVMQDRTGANDVLLVTNDLAIKGGDTATGASIANENTKLRFRPQALYIDFYMKRVAELIIALYQQKDLFDRKKAIAIADEEGKYYEEMIGPDDIKGDLQFVVTSASSLAESDEQKIMKYANLKNLYAEDQTINQEVFDKPLLTAAGVEYTKAKIGKEEGMAQLKSKLDELVARANQPDFANLPPAIRNKVLVQINNLRQMLGAQAGPGEPPVDESQGPAAPSL